MEPNNQAAAAGAVANGNGAPQLNGGAGYSLLPSREKHAHGQIIRVYRSENLQGNPLRVWIGDVRRDDVQTVDDLLIWVEMIAHTDPVTEGWNNTIYHYEGYFQEDLWRLPSNDDFLNLVDQVTVYRG